MAIFSPPVHFEDLGLDPVALTLGPLELRWYSLAYIAGILVAWWLLGRMLRKSGAPFTKNNLDDLVAWCTLGVILGGRLAYVLFYDLASYLDRPMAIFRVWEGGMSFHGGLFGVATAVFLYARKHHLSLLRSFDYLAVVVPFGLMLGRLANFINGELWGRPTDGTWGVIFPYAGHAPRHPSQLYEAFAEGLLLFVVLQLLFWLTNARLRPGLLTGLFVAGYGVARFLIELVREPDSQLGVLGYGLTMGQTLTLPLILIGVWLLLSLGRRERITP